MINDHSNRTDPRTILPDYENGMLPVIHSNKIYNRDAAATVTCGYSGPPNVTDIPLSRFTDVGLMQNTEVHPLPEDEEVLGWARQLLGIAAPQQQ